MPKATLEFTLPEENEEYKMTMDAGKYHSALWDFSQDFLRKEMKYNAESYDEKEYALLEKVRTAFYEACVDNGVEL